MNIIIDYIKKDYYQFKETNVKFKERIKHALLISILISFMVFIFTPIEYYLKNINEFDFKINNIITWITIFALISITFFILIMLPAKGRLFEILKAVFLSFSINLWLQANFLNPPLELDGITYYFSKKSILISLAVWLFTLFLCLFVSVFKNKIFNITYKYITICLFLIQFITLVIILLTSNYDNNYKVLSANENFNMSKNKNVILFIVDAYDLDIFNEQLKYEPEVKSIFKDFTYYNNYSSKGMLTNLMVPYLLTGEIFKNDMPYNDYKIKAYTGNNIIKQFNNLGFDTTIYTDKSLLIDDITSIGNIDNLYIPSGENIISSEFNLSLDFCRIGFIRYAPLILKQVFWFYPMFEKYNSNNSNIIPYAASNEIFGESLNGEWRLSDNNKFKYIHIHGYHGPQFESSISKTSEVVTNILNKYLEKLKQNNVYDNSFIIIAADHGGMGLITKYTHTATLLVKNYNQQADELSISNAPIISDDLIFSLLKAGGKEIKSERTIFDINEDEERERIHYVYSDKKSSQEIFSDEYAEIIIGTDIYDVKKGYYQLLPDGKKVFIDKNWIFPRNNVENTNFYCMQYEPTNKYLY